MKNEMVVDWLMDSDPAIRWQVMEDLLDAPAEAVATERAKVGREGWGAQLLAQQGEDGTWGGEAFNQGWDSTMHALSLLREMGLDPASAEAKKAIGRVVEKTHWRGWDWDGKWQGMDFVGNAFFDGEVEPCINGQVGASGAYFGVEIERILDWLTKDQLGDGGWNCEIENGATVSSFDTTINVIECLWYSEAMGGSRTVGALRRQGEEYLLERGLFRRKSTGEVADVQFTQFAFPTWWHYDVLRGLEHFRRTGVKPDARLAEAVELVNAKRGEDGRWLAENKYPGKMLVEVDVAEGEPSRWNTLRALRVLRWYSEIHPLPI
jgi:hypothetical protein